MPLHPIASLTDNYIWALHDAQHAVVVDPGQSTGVWQWLAQHGLRLQTIFLTHHHADHVGGVAALQRASGAQVVGPRGEVMPEPLRRVGDGDVIPALGLAFEVLEVPGHTAGHIAFFCPNADGVPVLFCGDVLFSAGCGRVFEGTPAQMLRSLDRLSALPDATLVCCAHEYTLSNLAFAQAVEPLNAEVAAHLRHCQGLRQRQMPTRRSTMGLEKQINPFLRTRHATIRRAVATHYPQAPLADDASVFAALRAWKQSFQ